MPTYTWDGAVGQSLNAPVSDQQLIGTLPAGSTLRRIFGYVDLWTESPSWGSMVGTGYAWALHLGTSNSVAPASLPWTNWNQTGYFAWLYKVAATFREPVAVPSTMPQEYVEYAQPRDRYVDTHIKRLNSTASDQYLWLALENGNGTYPDAIPYNYAIAMLTSTP